MKLLFTSLLLGVFFASIAQKEIHGTIIDQQSRQPISGAIIYLDESHPIYISDKKGEFKIPITPEINSITLSIKFLGYSEKIVNISKNDFDGKVTIEMLEIFQSLPEVQVESSTMIGGASKIGSIPGSATYLSPKELNKFSYSDPMRSLKGLSGMNIQEEDGFGLRPNIGMRGTGVERSAKITIMEDGILMAPAPYAAPAAYYFPSFGRMQGVEILKGSSQIKYGPYTNGGVINFISNSTPKGLGAQFRFDLASNNSKTWNALAGFSNENYGFSIEGFGRSSDGFKTLDNGGNTGFNQTNWLARAHVNFEGKTVKHRIGIKMGLTEEVSNETYLGLTDDDFKQDPYRRYAASQMDQMVSDHTQASINYTAVFQNNLSFSTSIYKNSFNRNWYKLDKVTNDSDQTIGISNILQDPSNNNNAYQILIGQSSLNDEALHVKANNRSYLSQGIQAQMGWNKSIGDIDHKLEIGLRYHEDQMDRFQWVDDYKMSDGIMMLTTAGVHGTESNRIEGASALASFAQYKLKYNRITFIPGIRYENISVFRDDYGKSDPERVGTDLTSRSNNLDIWIPGAGIHYAFNEDLNAFIGIHKGFSPPGSKEGTLPEESINYELGFRHTNQRSKLEVIAYYNDYANLLGVDFNAGGGSGSNDLFNAGKAVVYGAEVSGSYDILPIESKYSLPIGINYTYTIGEFKNSFESSYEPWEKVNNGDLMPYLAPHQIMLFISLEHNRFSINASGKYTTTMRTIAGTGAPSFEESIPENFIVDLSAQYILNSHIMIFGGVQNLMDKVYIVSRRPSGVRPGLPRWFNFGLKFYL